LARYGQEFKDRAVARLLPPESASIKDVANESGVAASTLERWRSGCFGPTEARAVWTAAARFDAVLTTAAMDEVSKSAWCRTNGVYPQELATWRDNAMSALSGAEAPRTSAHETTTAGVSRRLNARSGARTRRLPRPQPCWCCQKKSRRSSTGTWARTNDRPRRSPTHSPEYDTTHKAGARLYKACDVMGIDVRALQRWQTSEGLIAGDLRPTAGLPLPAHALNADECA
jgi:transposase